MRSISFILLLTLITAPCLAAGPAKKVRLFILSGQSNMVGMDPAKTFTPAIEKAFPGDDNVIIKHAVSGQPIRYWFKDWRTLPGDKTPKDKEKLGYIYDDLMTEVTKGTDGKAKPVTITFVWMQGEADARQLAFSNVYAVALQGVVDQLQKDLGRKDIDVVIGRLSDCGLKQHQELWPGWQAIRDIQVKFADSYGRGAWVDTDDLNGDGDGLHYTGPGYNRLGERFAAKAIELINGKK